MFQWSCGRACGDMKKTSCCQRRCRYQSHKCARSLGVVGIARFWQVSPCARLKPTAASRCEARLLLQLLKLAVADACCFMDSLCRPVQTLSGVLYMFPSHRTCWHVHDPQMKYAQILGVCLGPHTDVWVCAFSLVVHLSTSFIKSSPRASAAT